MRIEPIEGWQALHSGLIHVFLIVTFEWGGLVHTLWEVWNTDICSANRSCTANSTVAGAITTGEAQVTWTEL
jgi:hypothetical protein